MDARLVGKCHHPQAHSQFKLRLSVVAMVLVLIVTSHAITSEAFAQDKPAEDDAALIFQRDILPIFDANCLHCHGKDEQESKLRLDTLVHLLRGGNSGEPVLIIGDDAKSHLIELLTAKDEAHRMPPFSDPLPDEKIETVRKWIRTKNGWEAAVKEAKTVTSEHWSYQPVRKPSIQLKPGENPVDYFINKRLHENKLAQSPAAEQRALVRRLYLVLHGLPPTPQQVEEFCRDTDSAKWQKLIDRLLEDSHYGERMAIGWLDLVRFSETHGFETNTQRYGAWRYRDWVIKAFNADMPYDKFVTNQLAGDATGEPIATGYLVAGPHNEVGEATKQGQLENAQNETSDMLNTIGTSLIGTTLGCARCHNHKFDPISQTDFYSVQAVFSGVNHGTTNMPISAENQRLIANLEHQIQQLRDDLRPYQAKPGLRESVNSVRNVETFLPTEAKFVRLTINATKPGSGEGCIDELEIFSNQQNVALSSLGATAMSGGDFVHRYHKLEHINDGIYGNEHSWISKELTGWVQIEFDKVHTINQIVWARDRNLVYKDRLITDYQFESSLDGKNWHLLSDSKSRRPFDAGEIKYVFDKLEPEVRKTAESSFAQLQQLISDRSAIGKPGPAYTGTFSAPMPTHRLSRGDPLDPREEVVPDTISLLGDLGLATRANSAQRRKVFADWVVDPSNPLTARVMVNRIWQFHFGRGLVTTPSDFGLNGVPPTHPELLDWLAAEFVEHNWSIKHIHRIILNSKTWQQSSRPNAQALQIDGGTSYLWRFPPRRLAAEYIRDSILSVSGTLDVTMYGPGFSGFDLIKETVWHYFPKKEYGPADWRRMIYMTRVRREPESVFGAFDCPDGNQVTPRRTISTTPLQALNLLNSQFVMQQAEFLAKRIEASSDDRQTQIKNAFHICVSRAPSVDELAMSNKVIEELGMVQFCRIMLNTNEFVFIL